MYLDIKNLESGYEKVQILKGIDMGLEKGKFIGIIGPNGSGKSTLLKCIYRIKDYDGDIFLEGKNIKSIKLRDYAKKISVVQQINNFAFDLNVFDLVMMGRTPYKKFMEKDNSDDIRIAKEAISVVGLKGYENRGINDLSGGEKQRVILARAIAQDTETIILDEPTNHLDIMYQLHLMSTVKNMDKTVISAIHDINIALMYCDYIYALQNGKLIAEGDTDIISSELIMDLYKVKAKVMYDKDSKTRYVLYNKDNL